MFFGIDEPWIAKLARTYVKQNDIIYDIGAHIGYTTVLFAHYLSNSGQIHAFEILRSTTDLLKETVQANPFRNVIIHTIGLGAHEQTLELPIGNTRMTSVHSTTGNGGTTETCRITPLDKYVWEKDLPMPSLMKIDVEGAEVDCLKGALSLIKRSLPLLIVEFHSREFWERAIHCFILWGINS